MTALCSPLSNFTQFAVLRRYGIILVKYEYKMHHLSRLYTDFHQVDHICFIPALS